MPESAKLTKTHVRGVANVGIRGNLWNLWLPFKTSFAHYHRAVTAPP